MYHSIRKLNFLVIIWLEIAYSIDWIFDMYIHGTLGNVIGYIILNFLVIIDHLWACWKWTQSVQPLMRDWGTDTPPSFLIYNLCKQRHKNGLPSSEWIVNLASMLDSYGTNFIPEEVLHVKAAVKHMQIHIKNEYIDNWEA